MAQAQTEKMVLYGKLTLVLRGPDGRIKAMRTAENMKVYNTFNLLATVFGDAAGLPKTINCLGLGSGPDVVSADTALSGEISIYAAGNRSLGRYSHDANAANWNLSFSFTDFSVTVSIGQAGILTSLTGGLLFLKATFARITKQSQDLLNVSWLQSLASA